MSPPGSRNALPDHYHGDLFAHSDIAPAGRLRDVSDLIDVRSEAPHDLQRDEIGLERHGRGRELATEIRVEAPRYPILDLPFSLVLDTVMLPATINAEIFH